MPYEDAALMSIQELFPKNAIAALIEEMWQDPTPLDAVFPDEFEPGFKISYTIFSGGREMAPIVSLNAASVPMSPSDEYKIHTDPLVVKQNIPLTAEDLMTIGDPTDPNKLGVDKLKVRHANRIMGAIQRRKWWACAELLTKGQIYYVGGVQNPVRVYISFDLLDTHKRSVDGGEIADAWGTANGDPYGDIVRGIDLIDTDGGAPATHLFMNRNTMLLAVSGQVFRDQLINTSANISDFDLISRFKTMLKGIEIEPVLVNESYSAGGSNYRYLPDGYVSLISLTGNNAGNPEERFGETINVSSIENGFSGGNYGTGIWSKTLVKEDPTVVKMLGGNNFLPVIRYPDRLVIMKVTAGAAAWGTPQL